MDAAEYGNLQPPDSLKLIFGLGVRVCGLNQLIGSFSRWVSNKLVNKQQKVTLERDERLFMGDSRAGTRPITADNCVYPSPKN